ncbi:MAG: hypothetical protein JRN20_11675 [Nitrososphaerota archaeon]|nr:hypothetical protein [Nitrososphaerota archaeon]MDG6923215.1 hypothetical protein [Nitrososphaerota archaeon]
MKSRSLLFEITTAIIFLQLLLGGLLTFNFINAGVHIATGIIVLILAAGTMGVCLVEKPKSKPLQITSVLMVILIVFQVILGFDTLRTNSQIVACVHFLNAMLIYGAAVSGTFITIRLDRGTVQQKVAT